MATKRDLEMTDTVTISVADLDRIVEASLTLGSLTALERDLSDKDEVLGVSLKPWKQSTKRLSDKIRASVKKVIDVVAKK